MKRGNKENCKVKVLPWQQFFAEFAENCREVTLDLYEDIVKVWEEGTFMLSCKEETKVARYAWKVKKKNGCHSNNFCHFFMLFYETVYYKMFHWYKDGVEIW